MDYLKHYQNLMKKTLNRNLEKGIYFEKHHILPTSIKSSGCAKKLLKDIVIYGKIVNLLPQEHYVAHALLVKVFKNKNKDCFIRMMFAFSIMKNKTNNNKKYALFRKDFSNLMKEKLTGNPSRAKGCHWSEERRKIGVRHLKGKTYEEICGIEKAKELKALRSKNFRGSLLKRFGEEKAEKIKEKLSNRIYTKEWRERISKINKGKKRTEEQKRKMRMFLGNPKNNWSIDKTLYTFTNKELKQLIAFKYYMRLKYGCHNTNFNRILNGKGTYNKGWNIKLLEN